MSTLVGKIVIQAQETTNVEPHIIASCLAVICGAIDCALGLLRLGFIVDFIPLPAITAFMTGSAVNIISGQVSSMLGEQGDVNTRGATYMTIIQTLRELPTAGLDAAMGVTACAMLYIIRFACNIAAKKQPHRAKFWFFVSTLRTVFVILFYTMISAAVNLHRRDNPAFKVLETVPRGKIVLQALTWLLMLTILQASSTLLFLPSMPRLSRPSLANCPRLLLSFSLNTLPFPSRSDVLTTTPSTPPRNWLLLACPTCSVPSSVATLPLDPFHELQSSQRQVSEPR